MHPHKATTRDKLGIAFKVCRMAVNRAQEAKTVLLALPDRTVKAGKEHIDWNKHCKQEENKRGCDGAMAAVQGKKDVEQSQNEKRSENSHANSEYVNNQKTRNHFNDAHVRSSGFWAAVHVTR